MFIIPKFRLMKLIWFAAFFFCFMVVSAQQTEYRITDDGQYQYLSDRQEAGMVYDESLGTYYKSITVRTFFLETQRKGYIPDSVTFTEFTKLTLDEQRGLLQMRGFDTQCSTEYLSPECLDFTPPSVKVPRSSKSTVIDLTPKCSDKTQVNLPYSLHLILNPQDQSENIKCGADNTPFYQREELDSFQRKQDQIKKVKFILGKD